MQASHSNNFFVDVFLYFQITLYSNENRSGKNLLISNHACIMTQDNNSIREVFEVVQKLV